MSESSEGRPYEADEAMLHANLEGFVDSVFSDLQSQFLLLPRGPNFVKYADFQEAYEALRQGTASFTNISTNTILEAVKTDSLSLVVLRCILGFSPPEWAEITTETVGAVPLNFARNLDVRCRHQRDYVSSLDASGRGESLQRIGFLIDSAIAQIGSGPFAVDHGMLHRLEKVDTSHGLESVIHSSSQDVPYAMVLYERLLGRPWASHRDSVSELVGDIMESAIEKRLSSKGIKARRTKRAETIPGFVQVPDFFIPDEIEPAVVIEAKMTGDDGTARDKVARIERLVRINGDRVAEGHRPFEVVACIDGRGFGVRRNDMKNLLTMTQGKVFTLATLDDLVSNTRLAEYAC